MSLCLSVSELSTPMSIEILSMAGPRHALTMWSKDQRIDEMLMRLVFTARRYAIARY